MPTSSTSALRTFVTPPLDPAKAYSYTLKAEAVRDGRTVSTTKEITVRAGQETDATLNLP